MYNWIIIILLQQGLITLAQVSYLGLLQAFNKVEFLDALIEEGIIDNDRLLGIFHENYQLPMLKSTDKIKIKDYYRINEYSKKGYFVYEDEFGEERFAITNVGMLPPLIAASNLEKIILVRLPDFYLLLEQSFSHLNTYGAKHLLGFISPLMTAKNIGYKKAITGFFIVFCLIMVRFINVFHIINNICYFVQNFLKIFLFKRASVTLDPAYERISASSLPIYSVLVPLYKEAKKVNSIIESMTTLNYPKAKLDVKIIVEADDDTTINELAKYRLPQFIQIIKVPFSLPRTKPKALNYAMNYCLGKYAVIYDAEDQPHPDQLLEAASAFAVLPEEYVCLQAKLNFYNADENLLTKFFSLEYSVWFDYLLKGLSLFNFPVTLGGTSNHFKVEILRNIGNWDAYNVTEDADLGIRFYVAGYKVHMINSYTLEEAPITIDNWMNQRARWIKGYIQTLFVFLRQNKRSSPLKATQIMATYIVIGVSTYSFFCLPWLLLMAMTNLNKTINYLWLVNSFFALSCLYGSALHILLSQRGKAKNFTPLDWLGLIFWPCYFLLHTVASYKAIWQSIRNPFQWNKTEHGVSAKNGVK